MLGELVRANPGRRLYTATKVPPKNLQWPSRRGSALTDVFPPDHIRASAEISLANLGLPSVDLIQFHVWEDDWAGDQRLRTPYHETLIYEAHVRGLTLRHPGVPEELRGSYAGR